VIATTLLLAFTAAVLVLGGFTLVIVGIVVNLSA